MSLAVILGARCHLQFGQLQLRPNLYAIVLAPSTTRRKGQAINWARRVVSDVDEDLLLPSSGSVEGLIDALVERPEGMVVFDELARLFARSKKDYAVDLPQTLCELYDGSPYRGRTTKHGLKTVSAPVVSLFGASAPDPLLRQLGTGDVRSGLLPRFLVIPGTQSDVARMAFPPPIDGVGRDIYIQDLKSLYITLKGQSRSQEVRLLPEAHKAYEHIYQEMHVSYPEEEMAAFVERHGPMVLKIAMVIGYAKRRSFVLESSDVIDASKPVHESLKAFRALMEEIDARESRDFVVLDAKKVLKAIDRLAADGEGPAQYRDILNRSHLASTRAKPALLHLTETGTVIPVPSIRGCRWERRPHFPVGIQSPVELEDNVEVMVHLAREHLGMNNGRGK